MQSAKFSWNKSDLVSGLRHLLWYGIGAALLAVLVSLQGDSFGTYQVVVTVFLGFCVDMVNKYFKK